MEQQTGRSNAEQFAQLRSIADGLAFAAMVQAAARLRLADAIGAQPADVADLAEEVGADPDALRRLLRGLASLGVFRAADGERYAHTELSRLLRSEDDGGGLDVVLMSGLPLLWELWQKLDEAVRTGTSVFPELHKKEFFRYLSEEDPESGATFNRAMTGLTKISEEGIPSALDLAGMGTLADIGGGHGRLLRTLLKHHPGLHGVLFDLEPVLAGVCDELRSGGELADRCVLVPGDLLHAVPVRADLYLLKHVLHGFDDDTAVDGLRNIAAAAPPGARIVVVEQVLDGVSVAPNQARMDLVLLLTQGGKERTEQGFMDLFARAGLRWRGLTGCPAPLYLIEGTVD